MNLPTHTSLFRPSLLFTAALIGLLALAASGCGSLTGSGSASFASVIITNHTSQEISSATTQVFIADGYRGSLSTSGQMVFEKEASRGTTFAHEGLAATYYGAQTINRVRVDVVPMGDGSYRLQCKAYLVTGGSDPFFQEEKPITNMRGGPYQSLLDKVAERLK
jgi:hypothetical protein